MKIEKLGMWIAMLLMLVVMLTLFGSLDHTLKQANQESLHHIEEAIRKAAIQCYALEGSYPPNVEYLEMHYGLILNSEAYFYHYEIIGSNIKPQIGVYRRWN